MIEMSVPVQVQVVNVFLSEHGGTRHPPNVELHQRYNTAKIGWDCKCLVPVTHLGWSQRLDGNGINFTNQ